MAISAYVGIPGSGKSYEVVKSVILNAFLSGRRIVTNIEGINNDAFVNYAINKKKAKKELLGEIMHVTDDMVMRDNFFPFKIHDDSIQVDTICQLGDLIVIDEVWRIWTTDAKIPANHKSFIAEHRHFTSTKSGLCCDLVVINQSIDGLPKFLIARIETTYKMSKHIALGLSSRYRIDVYNGVKTLKNAKISSFQEKYNKDIFKLYKSYDSENGKESVTDKRSSIFANKKVFIVGLFIVTLLFFSAYYLYQFFKASAKPNEVPAISTAHDEITAFNLTPSHLKTALNKPVKSQTWRIAGTMRQNGLSYVILVDNNDGLRLEPASNFNFDGLMLQGLIDDELVTKFTGAK